MRENNVYYLEEANVLDVFMKKYRSELNINTVLIKLYVRYFYKDNTAVDRG